MISAVGADPLGEQARSAMAALGVDATLVQSTDRFTTGTALVRIGPEDQTSLTIQRPAAYVAVELSGGGIRQLVDWSPAWLQWIPAGDPFWRP